MVARSLRYIASGSSSFSPSLNAVVGAVGETSTSAVRERLLEVAGDQRAHLLRLAVVGVVVAAGQRVGAEDDAALDLVAEAGVAGRAHDVLGRRRRHALGQHAQAVAHRVELREVRRRLGREDQVVGRQRVHEGRAGHLDDLRAGADHQVDRLLEALAARRPGSPRRPSSVTTPIVTPDRSPVAPCSAAATSAGSGWSMLVESSGSWPPITSCSRAASSTVRVTGPGLVERVGQRDEAVARDPAVRRLHARPCR